MTATTVQPSRPIRLHRHRLSGHSHRVELFLSILGLPFELVEVDLVRGAQRAPEFLALNPFGQVPAIEDGGTVVADSLAILVYLAARYDASGRWHPRDPVSAAAVQRWFGVAAGPLFDGPAQARVEVLFRRPRDPRRHDAAGRLFAIMEAHLVARAWLVSEAPTLADLALYSYTSHAPEGGVSLESYPAVRAWLSRVEALPRFVGMQRSPLAEPLGGA